jgi:hypothetical protein
MSSPLAPYINGYLYIAKYGSPGISNGRITQEVTSGYLLKGYLKRQDAPTTETGSKKVPKANNDGSILPGAAGEMFLYRGYILGVSIVSDVFNFSASSTNELSRLSYQKIDSRPSWVMPGMEGYFKFGDESNKYFKIERFSGAFGGSGIDEIIYYEIGGVPIVISGGEVQN